MEHFFQQLNSYHDLQRKKLRELQNEIRLTVNIVINVIINNAVRYFIIRFTNVLPSSSVPDAAFAFSAFFATEISITSIRSVSPEAIFVFLIHPLLRCHTSYCLHKYYSHGSHHTQIANTMIHCNLIMRNQLIFAKMFARSIRLTRPLIVTELLYEKILLKGCDRLGEIYSVLKNR